MNLTVFCMLLLSIMQWGPSDSYSPSTAGKHAKRTKSKGKRNGRGPLTELIDLTDEMKQEFVDAHNKARASVNPPAADMTAVVWDDKISEVSDKVIKKCRFIHSKAKERTTTEYPWGMGENIFIGMSQYHQKPAYITSRWDEERNYYHFDGPSCDPGKMCGHYTQVVWANTRKIGCAMAKCRRIKGTSMKMLDLVVVCHYGPPGNYIGKQPYKVGKQCSQCPKDTTRCMNGLCSA